MYKTCKTRAADYNFANLVPAVATVKGDRLGDCISVNRSQSYVNSIPMPIIQTNKNNRNIIIVTDTNWFKDQSVSVTPHSTLYNSLAFSFITTTAIEAEIISNQVYNADADAGLVIYFVQLKMLIISGGLNRVYSLNLGG